MPDSPELIELRVLKVQMEAQIAAITTRLDRYEIEQLNTKQIAVSTHDAFDTFVNQLQTGQKVLRWVGTVIAGTVGFLW